MLPTIIFGIALLVSIILLGDLLDYFVNKEVNPTSWILIIITVLLWSYYHYLMH